MGISKQIGWSPKANLYYQISQQFERLIGVTSKVVLVPPVITYYNVAGCERMEYDVIKYNGPDVLVAGTIVSNNTPECWSVVDVATGPENVGTVQTVWNADGDCAPCIAAHFSNTIYWGEDSVTACAQTIPIYARGTGTTFCNSNTFYSEDFRTIGTGTIVISYDGQLKTVNVTSGSDVATFNGGCDPCPPPTIIIGTQEWTARNLDVTTYRNGDVIPQVQDPTQWANLTTGAWCWYDNSYNNGFDYGKLYNWYAVNDARGLAPTGFHIPSNAEITTLKNFLDPDAGGKMKEIGISYWVDPNTGATNTSLFTGLGGGYRANPNYSALKVLLLNWVADEVDLNNAYCFYIFHNSAELNIEAINPKNFGLSIRCVKD